MMNKEYYYDVTVHCGIVNNACHNTIEKTFDSLEEAIEYADKHWGRPLKPNQHNLYGNCEVVREFRENDVYWDLITITRMEL